MTAAQAPDRPPVSAVANANRGVLTAFLAQDAPAIAQHYTPESRLLLSQVELISGRPAIQAFWQGLLDVGIYCAERNTVEWQSAAAFGNEIGAYVLRRRDGSLADQGSYVALWQWRAGHWQIRYEVWRSSWLVSWHGQEIVVGRSAMR